MKTVEMDMPMHLPKNIHLTLRTKIILITTLIIVLIQVMGSVLEIGFLYRDLEQNSLKKYQLIGKEAARKLETSLLFGKPLDQLDFERLLEGIMPEGVDNAVVVDTDRRILYSRDGGSTLSLAPAPDSRPYRKNDGHYLMSFPLIKQHNLMGYVVLWVPVQGIQDKLFEMIRVSVQNSLIIIVILVPLLYLVLTVSIEVPFRKMVQRMRQSFVRRDVPPLLASGIDMRALIEAENRIETLEQGEWLAMDGADDKRLSHREARQVWQALTGEIGFQSNRRPKTNPARREPRNA